MVKKYTDKHAVRIVREEDKQDLIAFFEAIKSVCNDHFWESAHIEIGELWFIDNYGSLACFDPKDDLSDYTILEGIPEDWREEMGKVKKDNSFKLLKVNRQMERALMDTPPKSVEEISLESKIHKLESTQKEKDKEIARLQEIVDNHMARKRIRHSIINILEPKINQIESENKELTDILREIISLHEECGVKPLFAKCIQKAKKLLNK